MLKKSHIIFFCFSLSLLLSACGGGGGGTPAPPPAPTKAIIKVSTANVPTGTLVGGVQAAFTLPTGTFLPTDTSTGEVINGIVTISGIANGSLSQLAYNPTTRLVNFIIANSTGFGNGEILTITASITSGATVQTSDFPTIASTSPYPLQIIDNASSPNIINAATCPITVAFQ